MTRQHRFAPSDKVVESIRFIFWHCAEQFEMSIHETVWMSNHAHICLTDNKGELPKFMGKMNSLISRQLNAIRGLSGTNIEKGYFDMEVIGDDAMIRNCAYILANPCAADLVSTATAWKGITTVNREYGEEFKVKRPNTGLWKNEPGTAKGLPKLKRNCVRVKGSRGRETTKKRKKSSKLPTEATGVLVRPRVRLDRSDSELREEIRAQTKVLEEQAARKRKHAEKSVLGWARVKKIRWYCCAKSFEKLFEKIPTASASDRQAWLQWQLGMATFRARYARELDIYRFDCPNKAVFPKESWKMKEIYNAYYDPLPSW